MKKFIRTILISFAFVLAAALLLNLNIGHNFAFASSKTIFMVNPSLIATTAGETYVFDSSDECLKLMKEDSTESSSYSVGKVIDMSAVNGKIYLLRTDKISCFNTETKEVSDIIMNLGDYKFSSISASYQDEKVVLLTYSKQNNELYYFLQNNVSFDRNTITISQANEESVDYKFITYGEITYLMQTTKSSIFLHFPVVFGSNITLSTTTKLILTENTADIKFANYTNNKLAITYETKTDIYNFKHNSLDSLGIVTSDTIEYAQSVNNVYDEKNFVCKDTSFDDTNIYLLTKNGHYTLNLESNEISTCIQNPVCTLIELDKEDFEYYKVKEDSVIISTLGTERSEAVPEGAYVTRIADVNINSTSALLGYKYVVYTNYYKEFNIWKCENIFGYINDDSTNLELIETTENDKTIKVLDNTQLLSYPSLEVDSINTVLMNIGQHTPVKLLLDLGEFKNGYEDTDSLTNKYCLVQVGSNIGFISASREMSEDRRVALVISNATVLADAIIYEKADKSSYAQTILKADSKVKIIGPRDGNGFVKIAYNDEYGNYYEGYITASYVRSNSFTTLQIIGVILVLINVCFLVVLFITRKKITK